MSSQQLSLQSTSWIAGGYIPKKYKYAVRRFMFNIEKQVTKNNNSFIYPMWINGIIIVFVDKFYYAMMPEIILKISKISGNWNSGQKILIDTSKLLRLDCIWNEQIMKCIGMKCICNDNNRIFVLIFI